MGTAKRKIETESAMIWHVDQQYPFISDEEIEGLVGEDVKKRDRIIMVGKARRQGHRSIDIAYLKAVGRDPKELDTLTDPQVKLQADQHHKERIDAV